MIKKAIIGIGIFVTLFFTESCKFQKLLKSDDTSKKFEMAVKYFETEDYYRSLQLLEELVGFYRGTANAEKTYYYYAYCHYYQRDYLLANFHFKNFVTTFPTSKYAEESSYMSAYCLYLDSPDYFLDQSNTINAIRELQVFVNTYPKSTHVPECNDLIDKLRFKLEQKDFEIAKLYLKTENYKAAVTAFKNVIKEYPNSQFKEEVYYGIIEAYYYYATKSISSKKNERFQSSVDAYNVYHVIYPQGKFSKGAESIYKSASKEINKVKNKNI